MLLIVGVFTFGFIYAFLSRPNQSVPGWNVRMKECPYNVDIVNQALAAFTDAWSDAFGADEAQKIIELLNMKRWFGLVRFTIFFKPVKDERWYEWKVGGVVYKFAGHMISRHSICVAFLPDDSLGATAFFHELTHPSLLLLKGAPDNNHAEPPGPWTNMHDAMIATLKSQFMMVTPERTALMNLDRLAILNTPPPVEDLDTITSPVICGTCSEKHS